MSASETFNWEIVIFGVMLNNVSLQSHDYSYYQRYCDYDYYIGNGEEEMETAAVGATSPLDPR